MKREYIRNYRHADPLARASSNLQARMRGAAEGLAQIVEAATAQDGRRQAGADSGADAPAGQPSHVLPPEICEPARVPGFYWVRDLGTWQVWEWEALGYWTKSGVLQPQAEPSEVGPRLAPPAAEIPHPPGHGPKPGITDPNWCSLCGGRCRAR